MSLQTLKPSVAVHKFSSCDGCQLAFLNAGEDLLKLHERVNIVHFAEAGPLAPEQHFDISFVEGSIADSHDLARIRSIRAQSSRLITLGACATSGGIQALRNLQTSVDAWRDAVYAQPEFIHSLDQVQAIADVVKVDYELWGCPINARQLLQIVNDLLDGISSQIPQEKLCQQCKRQQQVCLLVSQGKPCLGPITKTGCGALCPRFGRACYGCFGPAETSNVKAFQQRLEGLGLHPHATQHKLLHINNQAEAFKPLRQESRDEH